MAYDVTASGDFGVTTGAGTATFLANGATVQVSVTTTGDTTDEADGSVTLTLQANPIAYTLGTDDAATAAVADDDDTPTVTLALAPASIAEAAGQSTVTATLDHPSSEETTVTVSATPQSPATASDYTLSSNLELTIAAGDTTSTGTVTITVVDNAAHGPDKTVTVSATATNTLGITAPQDVTLTITDDDNAAPTGAPTIDDTTPVVGETLTADPSGIGDPDGLTNRSFTWQWIRVSGGTDTPISGATTASYTVVAGDVGATLKVEASFTDDDGTAETVESAATSAATALPIPTVSVARVSTPVAEGAGGAVHGDAHGGDDGGADGPLQRVGERRHGGVGRGGREDRRFRGRRYRADGDGADGGGQRPRDGQRGDGDPDGGCGLRLGDRRHGNGHGRGRRRLPGDRLGHDHGYADGIRDADGGHVGHLRRGRPGQRGLHVPVGADALRRQ